jgi:tRNA(fMet)-specific endonuclease VapC
VSLQLDTDSVIEILRGNPKAAHALATLSPSTNIAASSITAAELYHGAQRSADPVRRVQEVASLLSGITVLPVDEAIAARFGELKASLQAAGTVIADFDLLIAATALVHNLRLVTHNTRHLARIPGLLLDDWLAG